MPTKPLFSRTPVQHIPGSHVAASHTTSHTTRARHRVGMVSTYPPKICGLATFASALETELRALGHTVDMVRIDDGDGSDATPLIGRRPVADLVNGVAASVRNAAAILSRCDLVIVQHEYGIFGGEDGDEVLDLLRAITVPTVVVLHTVPLQPTVRQRSILADIAQLADRVVVMTEAARVRLLASYPVDAHKVVTIPHGAASMATHGNDEDVAETHQVHTRRPQLLTWGLLGPGKGIEHMIDALALLRDVRPRPRYTVAGVTHPKVFARKGDEYRHSLISRAFAKGVAGAVTFDDTYRDVQQLTRFVASASVVVLPYDSRDQVTSGVLVDAIAAGIPVIATAFPHAVELLATGAGIVVPHADPVALAAAIRLVTTDEQALADMVDEAQRIAPLLTWSSVAAQYARVADRLVSAAANAVAM